MRSPFSRDLPREVNALVGVAFFVALGFGILVPAIPLFAKTLHASNLQAGMVISAFAACRFISAPLWGRLIPRYGERVLLAIGIGIVAISSFVAGFSNDIAQLIVLRGIGGIGSAMFTVSALSLLLRVAHPDQRGRASASFQGGFLVGGLAGPAIGIPLVVWSLRAPFFFYAGTLLAAGAVALVYLRTAMLADPAVPADTTSTLVPFRTAIRNRAYVTALVNSFANGWAQSGTRSLLLPLLVVKGLDEGRGWVSAGIFLTAAVQLLTLGSAGSVSDSRGRKVALLTGECIALGAVLVLTVFEALPVYLLVMAVFGISGAFVGASSSAIVGDVIGGRGGTAVAGYQMASDGAVMIAPLVLGALTNSGDYRAGLLASACVSAVGLVFVATMPETLRRRTGPPSVPIPEVTPEV